MLPSVLLNQQYSSLLGDLSTRQLDLTATWEISNESRNIETQIALDGALGSQVLAVPEGAICAPASLSSVAKLLLWLERSWRRALPCNSMQLAWQQLSFTLGVAKKSKAPGLLVQLYTKLDSALQVTAEYPAALSLSSCRIRSQKSYIPKERRNLLLLLVGCAIFFPFWCWRWGETVKKHPVCDNINPFGWIR